MHGKKSLMHLLTVIINKDSEKWPLSQYHQGHYNALAIVRDRILVEMHDNIMDYMSTSFKGNMLNCRTQRH